MTRKHYTILIEFEFKSGGVSMTEHTVKAKTQIPVYIEGARAWLEAKGHKELGIMVEEVA